MQQGEKDPETDNYVLTYEKMFEVLEAKLFEKVEAEIESPIRLEDGSGTTAANNTNTTTNNNNNNNNIASSPHSNTHGSDANLPGRKSLTSSITNIASVVTGRNKHQHHHHNRKESHIAEHVIQLSQCPICQKHLGRRNDLDVVSHVAVKTKHEMMMSTSPFFLNPNFTPSIFSSYALTLT